MRTTTLLAIFFLLLSQGSISQERRNYIYMDVAPIGASIAHGTIESKFTPVNKIYANLNASERAAFHALYEEVKDGDEPPFPLEGLRPVFRQLMPILVALRVSGQATLFIAVDSDGKATGLRIGKGSTPEITKYLSQIIANTRFKPAICGGKRCAMEFPLEITVELPYPK